jgi:hypothetical protein
MVPGGATAASIFCFLRRRLRARQRCAVQTVPEIASLFLFHTAIEPIDSFNYCHEPIQTSQLQIKDA